MKLPVLLLFGSCVSAQEVSESIFTSPEAPTLSTKHANHCATLGFDVNALDCRLCDDLSTFLTASTSKSKPSKTNAVQSVGQECQKCCSDFSKVLEAEDRRYANVVLAVSHYRLKRYPTVANFVEHQASKIKGLEVQETKYRLPTLLFFDDKGVKMEEISVAYWDENSIAEFIDKKLFVKRTMEDETAKIEDGRIVEVQVKL